jgi:Skp family chaperone for outer membrane proteins
MKKTIGTAMCLGLLLASASAFAKGKACAFSDTAKLKEHLEKHVTYPAKGKDIKAACKKEMPNEFPKSEHACIEKKLKNNVEYKDSGEVMKALGVEATAAPAMPAQ